MQISISKSDYASMLVLIDRCVSVIQNGSPSLREYNYARRLRLIRKKIERTNSKNLKNHDKER